ncbi:hypothetical protein DACRYDRAFT_113529 [Dacryopinax primogenitus]|uniref:HNH nuclease domain-containing protein n=1 Tax=Dacryopinax primogenitus (strain DJM 731) TaxID=1858805 RepID=M5GEF8_DACPD|nr:uncharacterized protein DACRYDRAFT_113529 [Dacryopinax primogenitus]EJU05397.1 hypothetical protein DACRYDRAFT_113529 [Dacryopinax primogenitus]
MDESEPPSGVPLNEEVAVARLLGHLLSELALCIPNGAYTLAAEIESCEAREERVELGQLYAQNLLGIFRRRETPEPSPHPSRTSFDNAVDRYALLLREGTLDPGTAKIRALQRDGFKCQATGQLDENSVYAGVVEWNADSGGICCTTLSHIIPPAVFKHIDTKVSNRFQAATGLTILARIFDDEGLPLFVDGPCIHRLENVWTISSTIHDSFDRLHLWLEETEEEGVYHLDTPLGPAACPAGCLEKVDLRSSDSNLPPPSRNLIRIHRLCAKVAHMSGAAGYYCIDWDDDSPRIPPIAAVDVIGGEREFFEKLWRLNPED